jgi:hypothetical protein
MANLPISGLPAAGDLDGSELGVVVKGGVTSQTTAQALANLSRGEHPGYVANRYYHAMEQSTATGAAISDTANIRFLPFIPVERVTIDELGACVITVTGGGNFQLAIWAADPATKYPTGLPLAYTAPALSTAVAGAVVGALNVSVQLEPGTLYWLGINVDVTTSTFVLDAGRRPC